MVFGKEMVRRMKIQTMPLGMIQANCYLVSTEQKNAFVIDPGGEANRILKRLEEDGLRLRMILLTHGHHDHIAAVWKLAEATGAQVYIQKEDLELLQNIELSLCSMTELYFHYDPNLSICGLEDGACLELDELKIQLLHTPGHSKGSSCYQVGNVLFTGDTLFAGDIGRTDLYGGSYPQIKASLMKLAALEGDYQVYPGHGPATTLEKQRKENPYLGQVSYDDYF